MDSVGIRRVVITPNSESYPPLLPYVGPPHFLPSSRPLLFLPAGVGDMQPHLPPPHWFLTPYGEGESRVAVAIGIWLHPSGGRGSHKFLEAPMKNLTFLPPQRSSHSVLCQPASVVPAPLPRCSPSSENGGWEAPSSQWPRVTQRRQPLPLE